MKKKLPRDKPQFIIQDIPMSETENTNKDIDKKLNAFVDPKQVEPKHVEPKHVEPKQVDPKQVDPKQAELKKEQPQKEQSNYSVPQHTRTGTTITGFTEGEGQKTMVVDIPIYNTPMYEERKHLAQFAYLVCLIGPDDIVGKYWTLDSKKPVYIGRSKKCGVSISDPSISKKHLMVFLDEDSETFIVRDQKSTNGTVINDKAIPPEKDVEISDNSKVTLGNIIFKFLDRGNPEIFSIAENFERAFLDSLTKIGNRFMLEKRAEILFKQSKRSKEPLSFIIFDIDHFKKINDTYGHLAGDFILTELCNISKSHFRSNDLFVRSGGEEFCVIIQSLMARAEKVIENIRKKIESHIFEYKDTKIKITISAGVTCKNEKDINWKDLYERADKLLYKSKNAGRNRVFTSPT